MSTDFSCDPRRGIVPLHAGLFSAGGRNTHPTRVMDSHELIFVVAGRLLMFEEDRRFDLHRHHALLLQAGLRHGGLEPYSTDCRFYWVHFRGDDNCREDLNTSSSYPKCCLVSRPDQLTHLMRRYLYEQEQDLLLPLRGAALITLMLEELRLRSVEDAGHGSAQALARHAQEFLQAHHHEPVSTADVAAQLGCHPDHLGRCYRQTYGRGIIEALHHLRIAHSRSLLLHSPAPINHIAKASGFESAIYFRRIFKKLTGLTPTQFRHLHATGLVNTD